MSAVGSLDVSLDPVTVSDGKMAVLGDEEPKFLIFWIEREMKPFQRLDVFFWSGDPVGDWSGLELAKCGDEGARAGLREPKVEVELALEDSWIFGFFRGGRDEGETPSSLVSRSMLLTGICSLS
jgi:hypothetical protein